MASPPRPATCRLTANASREAEIWLAADPAHQKPLFTLSPPPLTTVFMTDSSVLLGRVLLPDGGGGAKVPCRRSSVVKLSITELSLIINVRRARREFSPALAFRVRHIYASIPLFSISSIHGDYILIKSLHFNHRCLVGAERGCGVVPVTHARPASLNGRL